jgi:hypothetical protein
MINIENLRILADYAEKHDPARFNMRSFARSADGAHCGPTDERVHECGTICCFAGLGPMAGIEAKVDEGWDDYIGRVFANNVSAWGYLFSGNWAGTPFNTLQHAIARARTVIELGDAPDGWTWYDPKVLEVGS